MISETEKRIGLLAVENRLLTKLQLAKALWVREKKEPGRPLEEVFVELGLLSPGQVAELARLVAGVQAPADREERRQFAERLLEQGLVTREQLDDALDFKYFLAGRGVHRYVGDILVERAGVPPARIVALLRGQGKRIVACPACRDQFNAPVGETFGCPECGRELVEVAEPASVAVRAALVRKREPAAETGVRIGPCEIRDVVSRGPHSSLYRAWHAGLRREVAVKLIPLRGPNAPLAARFFEQARRHAEVVHPAVARVIESGTRDTTLYVVRAIVEGVGLSELVGEGGRLPHLEAVPILRRIAEGLAAIHERGLVHGNLKAENVLVTSSTDAVLTDGGLGRDPEMDSPGSALHVLAPERWLGKPGDARVDLYAAGILFHFMLAGAYPFDGSPAELRQRHLRVAPPPVERVAADTPAPLLAILRGLLEKDPAKRYRSAKELIADLERFEAGKSVRPGGARFRKCGFCETLNPADAPKCSVCKEPMGAKPDLEFALRADEVQCRKCRTPVRAGTRSCPHCAAPVLS